MLCAASLWAGREFVSLPGEETIADELVVRLKPGADLASVVAAAAPGTQIVFQTAFRTHLVRTLPGQAANASNGLARNPLVEFVEPNRVRRHAGGLPALNDPNVNLQWALTTVKALSAWNIIPDRFLTAATAGSGRIRVAILDTGTDCTHSDFKNSGGTSVDSAQGGQLNLPLSQALVATTLSSPACAWQDDYGHGTHVAGIIAAATQNAVGIAGLGYPIEVVTYKILDSNGSGNDFTISQAIRAAADAGIHFVSMSLGGAGYSQNFQDAINYAWERNTLTIAAAGNGNSNGLFFPAGGNYVIGVAATDSNNNKASFSNWGPYNPDIAAPGVTIYSTMPGYPNPLGAQNYGNLSGTSMATPHVSALAGLIALTTPSFSVAAIAQRILQSANSSFTGGGWDQYLGYGIIDASRAVTGNLRTATVGGIVGQIIDFTGLPVTGATVTAGGQSFLTLSDGLYRLSNLAAGSYNVQVSASGFLTRNLLFVVRPGADTTATIAMGVVTGNFTGTVTSGGGAVGGAIVQALASGLIKGTAVSDSNGLYVLPMAPGTYDIQVSGISRTATAVTSKAISAGGTVTVNLTLPAMGTIAGTVRDNNSVPLANAQITFTQSGVIVGGAVSNASGNYSSIGLPSGTYSVTASSPGFSDSAVSGVVVSVDTVVTVNLQLTAPGSGITVSVSPATVSLQASQTQAFTATVTGTSNTGVTWSINPATGTMVNGLYTAPSTITSSQTVTVKATSVADNTKFGTATVNLVPTTSGPVAIGIFGTGVASAGVLAADGAVDAHYRLVGSPDAVYPGPNAIVVTSNVFPIPPWLGDGPNSKWIAPRADAANGNAVGTYTYRTTFDLTGLNPATAILTGQFASDNGATIKLNGVTVGPTSPTFNAFTVFTISSGFIAAVNTLDFVVSNDPCGGCINPTGLRVDISGTASSAGIAVSVSPATVNLQASQTQTFTATVSGTSNTGVTWSINPATGTMVNGLYTAPSTITSSQTVTVKATSVADNTKFGTATVNLGPTTSGPVAIGIFGTGVVSAGVLAADGAVDAHYRLVGSPDSVYPGPNAIVVTSNVFPIPPWLGDGPNSKWIAPRADAANGNAVGTYTYRTTFDLTGLNPATAVLTGQFASDNRATIKLNGVTVGPSSSTYNAFTAFTISSGFIAGVNTLDFVVTNDGSVANPTGLRVDISGTASSGGIAVSVSPATVNLQASQTQTFTATVTGTSNTGVTWSINPATGTMVNGLYTAPSTITSSQTVTVTATSVADNTKFGTATVNLVTSGPVAIGIFGTGVVSAGVLAADGAVDAHYRLVGSPDAVYPGPNAIVVTSNVFPIPPWVGDGPNSKWIAPRMDAANGNAVGTYTYRTTFDLTGLNPATAALTGQFASDNGATIKLNGVTVGPSSPTYNAFTAFTISSGFIVGVNTLDFVVSNDPSGANPTGVRVDISGTASH